MFEVHAHHCWVREFCMEGEAKSSELLMGILSGHTQTFPETWGVGGRGWRWEGVAVVVGGQPSIQGEFITWHYLAWRLNIRQLANV